MIVTVLAATLTLAASPSPTLTDLHVTDGSAPFAGDSRLLTTVSPNGDGFRDAASVRFRLKRPARVRLEVVATNMVRAGVGDTTVVWTTSRQFGAGAGSLTWHPAQSTQPRTYIMRLRVGNRVYGDYGPSGHQNAPVVRVQGIELGFLRRSYAPGEFASLAIATDAKVFRLQVFAFGSSVRVSEVDVKTNGGAVTPPLDVRWER